MKKEINNKKLGTILGITIAVCVIISAIVTYLPSIDIQNQEQNKKDDTEWHTVAMVNSYDFILGENAPGSGSSGWLSTFLLDYAQDPGTVLANNATDWSSDANTMGYVDTDDTDKDIVSEDPFYFVVRCRFNDTVKDGSDFMSSRCRCTLTVSGDETISGVAITGNDADVASGGRAVVSENNSADDYIWINFVWDDNSDGYQITDDGSLDWSITIEAKY